MHTALQKCLAALFEWEINSWEHNKMEAIFSSFSNASILTVLLLIFKWFKSCNIQLLLNLFWYTYLISVKIRMCMYVKDEKAQYNFAFWIMIQGICLSDLVDNFSLLLYCIFLFSCFADNTYMLKREGNELYIVLSLLN